MDHKTYSAITALMFLVIFVLHLLRLIYGWNASLAGMEVPMWASWLAMIISGFFSAFGFRLSDKK